MILALLMIVLIVLYLIGHFYDEDHGDHCF
jgi:hypothetical protein